MQIEIAAAISLKPLQGLKPDQHNGLRAISWAAISLKPLQGLKRADSQRRDVRAPLQSA